MAIKMFGVGNFNYLNTMENDLENELGYEWVAEIVTGLSRCKVCNMPLVRPKWHNFTTNDTMLLVGCTKCNLCKIEANYTENRQRYE